MEPYHKRKSICKDFGFKCKCNLCQLDRNDKNQKLRAEFIQSETKKLNQYLMQTVQMMKRPNVKFADEFVAKVKAFYSGQNDQDDELKLDLIYPLMIQAQFNLHATNYAKAAEIFISAFNLYKDIDEANAIMCLFEAMIAYNSGSIRNEARKCLKMAKDHFIGYQDYFIYICKSRLAEVEELPELLNSI